ncbi:MAG: hypothetical protein ABIG67_09980, partial [Pseudomonadota bacterium]
ADKPFGQKQHMVFNGVDSFIRIPLSGNWGPILMGTPNKERRILIKNYFSAFFACPVASENGTGAALR